MSDLTKTRMLLRRQRTTEKTTSFVYDDPDWFRATAFALDNDVWADMGEPDTITVTVETGDLLNDASAD